MSAESEALNAAAAQLYALIGEIKKSNGYLIHGANVGTPNAISVQPSPAVTSWSDDLFVAAHMPAPSTGTSLTLKVSELPAIPIEIADFSAIRAGDIRGTAFFKIRNTAGAGGPRATLLFLGPAAMEGRLQSLQGGVAIGIDGNLNINLLINKVRLTAPELSDDVILRRPNTGASTQEHVRSKLWQVRDLIMPDLPGPGSAVKGFADVLISCYGGSTPAAAGMVLGKVYPASALRTGVYPGTTANFTGATGLNGTNTGLMTPYNAPSSAVTGSVTGLWRLRSWSLVASGIANFAMHSNYLLRFERVE